MLTFKECYDIAKKSFGKSPTSCREFKDFYLFNFEGTKLTGTVFPAIMKKDGSTALYDITSDPEAFIESKVIPV